jgi:hypothetical protein
MSGFETRGGVEALRRRESARSSAVTLQSTTSEACKAMLSTTTTTAVVGEGASLLVSRAQVHDGFLLPETLLCL